jgi:uncharacterized protein (DUF2345 family)
MRRPTQSASAPPPAAAPADAPADAAHGSALERIEALMGAPAGASVVDLPSGRAVTVEGGASDRITVRNPQGLVELSIRFTAEGPVLSFAAAAIDLTSEGEIRVDCERLSLRARKELTLTSGGDLRESVAGRASLEAHDVRIEARRGDVAVKANDDVRLDGERVLLNS